MVLMKEINDNSVDMILCDLPYGTTDAKWDTIIPLDKLWKEYLRIIKDKGAIVLTCREPFTSKLVMSNLKMYKHKWVWNKKLTGNFALAKFMPLQIDEDILVFCKNTVNYYPIMRKGKKRSKGNKFMNNDKKSEIISGLRNNNHYEVYEDYYPSNILEIGNADRKKIKHPTEKPIKLFRYLIKTYTQEGELVLDNCIGSGTTAVACKQSNRNFIGIELNHKYVDICNKRSCKQLNRKYLGFEINKEYCEIAERRLCQNTLSEVSGNSSHN